MSSSATFACAVVALCLGVPVIAASAHVEAAHRAAAAADAAALAAADVAAGYGGAAAAEEPCALAQQTVEAAHGSMTRCELEPGRADVRVSAAVSGPFGALIASAHAGLPPISMLPGGLVGENGWAWPSSAPGVTQGFHDGYAIDLQSTEGAPLYAPYAGIVIRVGADGGGIPETCAAQPDWWRGPNHAVVIRHEYRGAVLYSSHNHVAPGSSEALGLAPGVRVTAGQAVALAGMSGCTSGPHTHFTLATTARNTHPDVNPYLYIGEEHGQ